MRETVGSLRAYFALVGLVGSLGNLVALFAPLSALSLLLMVAGLGMGIAYLYLAIDLKRLLKETPARARQLVLVGGAMVVLGMVVNLVRGITFGVVSGAVGLLIIWYLLTNLKRLAAEAAAPAVSQGQRPAPPASWYPDPTARHMHRYWDGTGWTDRVADNGQAGVDPLARQA